eukprot:CCRYP_015962-RA/>CCRYP_015962-RA protein AED:0.30 eAED:0.54 QI:0/0/0.5/1/0/0/2/285/171
MMWIRDERRGRTGERGCLSHVHGEIAHGRGGMQERFHRSGRHDEGRGSRQCGGGRGTEERSKGGDGVVGCGGSDAIGVALLLLLLEGGVEDAVEGGSRGAAVGHGVKRICSGFVGSWRWLKKSGRGLQGSVIRVTIWYTVLYCTNYLTSSFLYYFHVSDDEVIKGTISIHF